jgi:hypothetical protein
MNAFGELFRAFADNLCPAVVDSVADRLQIDGFDVEEGDPIKADLVMSIWRRNRMDRRVGEVHQEALRQGDAYVLVWPDRDGLAAIYPQRADQVAYVYDEELPGRALYAAKGWVRGDGTYRLNLYYADRIEKYVSRSATLGAIPDSSNALVPFEADGEPWPLPNPFGTVPVFHFATNAPVGGYGKSELADVVPLQDALNKAVADMLVAMEYAALPQRWVTGIEVEIDPQTGKPVPPFTPGFERIWLSESPDVRFGEFQAADLAQFIRVQESIRGEFARVSGTPFHYLMLVGGDWPSGEAMKTAETRFLSRVRDRMVAYGNTWEDAMRFALAVEGVEVEGLRLSVRWRDPAPRSEREIVETVALKTQIGLPKRQALIELGYAEAEVEAFLQEGAAEAQAAGVELLRALNRGGLPPAEIGGTAP